MAYTGLIKFTNHAATTLASDVTAAATSLSVASGDGALFPSLSGNHYFYATLEDATDATSFEVVKVTARSTDAFTITRAQDGTSAAAWSAGDKVQLRLPRKAITDLETQLSDYTDTVSAAAVSDTVYGAGWNGVTTIAPSKNAVYDKIETLVAGSVSDTAYAGSWDSVTDVAPSKNAVYDKLEAMISDTAYAGSWDSVTTIAPSKNAVYDKIEAVVASVTAAVSDTAYGVGWNGETAVAPSKNAVYDKIEAIVSDTVYGVGWDGDTTTAPSKNAVYDKIEAILVSGTVDDTAYGASWNGVTTIAPSKNVVYDKIEALVTQNDHHVNSYGASTAESAANNATYIGDAITAALAGTNNSTTVVFGSGTYNVATALTILIAVSGATSANITLIGQGSEGPNATVLNMTSGNNAFNITSSAAYGDAGSKGQIRMKGIKLTGAGTSIGINMGTTAKQIDAWHRHIFEDIYIAGFSTHVKILNTRQVAFRDCTFRGVETSGCLSLDLSAEASFYTTDITWDNCELSSYGTGSSASKTALFTSAGTVAGLKFDKCHFYHGATAAMYFTGSSGMFQDISITNTQFDYTAGATTGNVGIWLDNTDASTTEDSTMWKDFRIVGNYFQTYGKALYIQPGTAAETNVIAKQVTFSNNYVANCDVYSVSIQSTEGVTVNNNNFRHCGNSGSTSYAILMAGYNKGFTINGNTHVANRTGAAGSQVPQNSNIDAIIHLASGANYFSVANNVAQIKAAASNVISDSAGSVEKSVYGNIGFTYNAGYAGTTAYNYFDGTVEAGGLIIANGGFSGSGASLTSVNAATLDGIDSTGFALASHTHAASDINSGTLDNARVNWAAPGTIGSTTATTGKFTTLNATTTSYGLKVGLTDTPSEGGIAAFAVSGGSGMIIGWNKGSAATPVVESGATAYVNYSGAGTGGHQFFNFTGTISNWTSTTPTLLGGFASDGALYTVRSGATKYNWHLMGYTGSAPSATGYVGVYIDGVLYKLLAST